MTQPSLNVGHNAVSRQFVIKSETETHVHLEDLAPTGMKMILAKREFPFLAKNLNAIVTVAVTSFQLEVPEEPALVVPEKKLIIPGRIN